MLCWRCSCLWKGVKSLFIIFIRMRIWCGFLKLLVGSRVLSCLVSIMC